mmetsp:Transcript_18097/g.37823  ORF Transcript_18097/g.37823 Transcript_18097/m.37823 type:complete len:209 (-) Transcript_18097:336-962(-)
MRHGPHGGATRHTRDGIACWKLQGGLQFVLGAGGRDLQELSIDGGGGEEERGRCERITIGRHAPLPRKRHPHRLRLHLTPPTNHPPRRMHLHLLPPPKQSLHAQNGTHLSHLRRALERRRRVEARLRGSLSHTPTPPREEGRGIRRVARVRGAVRSDDPPGGGGGRRQRCDEREGRERGRRVESVSGGISRGSEDYSPCGLHREGDYD